MVASILWLETTSLQGLCLIAGARIPRRLTSDRNYTVSPVTNHSSKDSSYGLARGGTPNPDLPPAACPQNPFPSTSLPAPDLLRVRARREPEPGTDAGSDAPAPDRSSARRPPPPRPPPAPARPRGSERPSATASPAHPLPPPAPGQQPARRRAGRRPDAGGLPRSLGIGPDRLGGALTLAAAALADILSLSSAARGSSDPKLRATSPPAPHATDQINISRERAELGAGAAVEAQPTGRGLNSDKSPGSDHLPAPPGSSPRGAPGRRLPPSAASRSASQSSHSQDTSAPPACPWLALGASGRPRSPPGGSSEAGFRT